MNRAYILVYSDSLHRQTVTNALDRMSEVLNWRYDMPNCIYVISQRQAQQLAERFRSLVGTASTFVFVEVGANKQGWLTAETWRFLNERPRAGG